MNTLFAISLLSVVPIRAKAAHSSEMVSQILFGETLIVLEKEGEWVYIKTSYDNYEGWVDEKQIVYLTKDNYEELLNHTSCVNSISPITIKNKQSSSFLYLSAGASLSLFSKSQFGVDKYVFELNSELEKLNSDKFEDNIIQLAKQFLDVPYLWGGRTYFGIDCSGFSQIVYKMLGIKINRDASQQAKQGKTVDFLVEAQTGDLAFFDNEEGKITHVGIMLNNKEIIHASGRVKIDRIDDEGIFSSDLNKYSHKLRIIKRFV